MKVQLRRIPANFRARKAGAVQDKREIKVKMNQSGRECVLICFEDGDRQGAGGTKKIEKKRTNEGSRRRDVKISDRKGENAGRDKKDGKSKEVTKWKRCCCSEQEGSDKRGVRVMKTRCGGSWRKAKESSSRMCERSTCSRCCSCRSSKSVQEEKKKRCIRQACGSGCGGVRASKKMGDRARVCCSSSSSSNEREVLVMPMCAMKRHMCVVL